MITVIGIGVLFFLTGFFRAQEVRSGRQENQGRRVQGRAADKVPEFLREKSFLSQG